MTDSEGSPRTVFYISDRTGITAETLGHTLLTQFDSVEFIQRKLPFTNTVEKAHEAVKIINEAAERDGRKPLVFQTLVDDDIRSVIADSNSMLIDFFDTFIAPLEKELGTHSSHKSGLSHGISDDDEYLKRMDALNYTMNNDDGVNVKHFKKASIILIGASRCGKTPSCLFLALQFGIHAANYPILDDDIYSDRLPEVLEPYRSKIMGLTINPERLHHIRQKRRPNSQYASLAQCQKEISAIESMYHHENIPFLDTSHMSIEEIATTIIQLKFNSGRI